MFHLILNFSVIVFICYAVSGAARAILFGGKKQRRHAHAAAHVTRAAGSKHTAQRLAAKPAKRQAKIYPFPHSKKTARRDLRAA